MLKGRHWILAALCLIPFVINAAADTNTTPSLTGSQSRPTSETLSREAPGPTSAQSLTAVDYLRRLEEKNKDVRTMIGDFVQIKESRVFLEEHTYQGRFHYLKPNRFRIDYTGKDGKKDESTLLMLAEEMWDYTPSLQQALRVDLRAQGGRQREINQFLIGFGVQTQKALEFFKVSLGPADPTGKTFTLVFDARNPDETMNFSKATITFEADSLRPRNIILDEEITGDQTRITLGDVKYNVSVSESIFQPKWPKDTEIIHQ
jgi:outer membrane lipoprotein-sorting protein